MRLLLIHAGEFWYKPTEKAIKDAEELLGLMPENKEENALVIFTSVEENDPHCINELGEKVLEDISEVAVRIKPSTIVIYPYAHLSSKLAPPKDALKVLTSLEERMRAHFINLKVVRAPFGWYKSFRIYCLGHPLSELSKAYDTEELCSREGPTYSCSLYEATTKVDFPAIDETCTYLNNEGRKPKLHNKTVELLDSFGLKTLRTSSGEQYLISSGKSVEILSVLNELSQLIPKSLKLDYDLIQIKAGTLPINNVFWAINSVAINSPKKAVLTKDVIRNSFRRLATFDTVTESILILSRKTINELYDVVNKILHLVLELYKGLGLKNLIIINEGFRNISSLTEALKDSGWRYLVINAVGSSGKETSTRVERVRLASKVYGNVLLELSGYEILSRNSSFTLGTNIIGIYENLFTTAIVKAKKELEENLPPSLPIWLNPVQVKLLPVKDKHVQYAMRVANKLVDHGVRAFVDKRKASLGKRIRDAGKEWIPYIVVVGDREVKAEVLNVRIREEGKQVSLTVEELINMIKQKDPTLQLRYSIKDDLNPKSP